MNTKAAESRHRSKTTWGLGLFSSATIVLLACVWSGHSLGAPLNAMVLAGFGIGSVLIVWGTREEAQPSAPLPAATPASLTTAATDGIPLHLEKVLAEIAVLAWKIDRRAQKEPTPPKAILRNATRIIEVLGEHKVELVSYEGRRIFMGSDVDVLEADEAVEEDKVVEQHEPEIQIKGKLVRRALLTVGKKRSAASTPPAPPPESPATNQSANPDSEKKP